ncbi:hypothetical protein HPB47_024609 [Ixodes persulcatus]|uniref:Uncharacterized protein n=1 Tax=Ixodes persulcatus TaxID=34615 RepID=A0AC60Q3X3_IXOPE|nr:hypothetical protein HPB47_024609 [Ixodes persulcatus]
MNDSSGRRRGRPNRGPNDVRVKYATVSAQDRARLLDCSRRGGDLQSLARTLGINIKTARSIVRTDRDLPKARGGSKSTFNVDVLTSLTQLVDDHPTYTLKQLKSELQRQLPGLAISTSSIDRLLDGHGYSLKQVSLQPADRNRADVKEKRKVFATWLDKDGPQTLRFYVDETNFNIWCSRKFGRSKRGTEAAYMRERSEEIFIRPDDITVKEHRWRLLQSATQDAMQKIPQADCRAYDRHSFEFGLLVRRRPLVSAVVELKYKVAQND